MVKALRLVGIAMISWECGNAQHDAPKTPLPVPRSIGVVVRTSWSDTKDMRKAFREDPLVRELQIRVSDEGQPADMLIELHHDIEQLQRWPYRVLSGDGGTQIAAGVTIAFKQARVEKKLAAQIMRQHWGGTVTAAATPPPAIGAMRMKLVGLERAQDPTAVVEITAEEVVLMWDDGQSTLRLPRHQVRDVRLSRVAVQSSVDPLSRMDTSRFDPRDPYSATAAGIIVLSYDTLVVSFNSMRGMLAKIHAPQRMIEIAWENEGKVRVVTLQGSGERCREIKRLLMQGEEK